VCLADALGPETSVALLDRAELQSETPGRDIRAWAISAGSKRLLDVLGVWGELAEHAQPVTAVDITDSSLNDAFRPVLVSYDNRVEGDEPATYILESQRLNAALLRAAQVRGSITLLGGRAIAGFEIDNHGCTVDLEGGARLRTPLLAAPTAAPRGCGMAVSGGLGYPRSASSPPSGTRSRVAAAPCSISCRQVVRHPAAGR
jgi:2-octaprenyl-6-methoxyphenol hydroxylase